MLLHKVLEKKEALVQNHYLTMALMQVLISLLHVQAVKSEGNIEVHSNTKKKQTRKFTYFALRKSVISNENVFFITGTRLSASGVMRP